MILELLIAASCSSQGIYQNACSKALEAGTKQYGFYQNVDQVEQYTSKTVYKTVTGVTGETPWVVTAVAVKAYRDKAISYGFNPKVLSMDRITTKVGSQDGGNGSVNFEWRF